MAQWQIPITIVEYGRVAIVTAPTKATALKYFREHGWEELTNATDFKVTKVGPCTKLEEA